MDTSRPILACTDFSDPAATAVRTAIEVGDKFGAPVVVVYVVEDRVPPMIAALSSDPPEAIVARHVDTARRHIDDWVARHFAGRDVETRVLTGMPHDAIVEEARREPVAMIVVGHRGHGLLGHSLLGSTTARVVAEATCPVLVVREDG